MSEACSAMSKKQYSEAETLLKKALQESSEKHLKSETLHLLANLYFDQGQYGKSEEASKQAIALNADDDEAVDRLVSVYEKEGKTADLAAETIEKEHISAKFGSLDFGTYMSKLQRDIKKNWHPPKLAESHGLTIGFIVMQDGTLLDQWLSKSSGNKQLDKVSMDAVRDSAPFASLPSGAPDAVTIGFSFDYNKNNSWQSSKDVNIKQAEEKLSDAERRLQPDDAQLAWHMVETAKVYANYQRYEDAIKLYNKALAIQISAFGDKQPIVGKTMCGLGICYSAQGHLEDAEKYFKTALPIAELEASSNHDQEFLKETLENYGKLLYKLKRSQEGDKFFDRLKELASSNSKG